MTKQAYMEKVRAANPEIFAAEKIQIKVSVLLSLIEHSFQIGSEIGSREGLMIGGKFNEILTAMEKATRL